MGMRLSCWESLIVVELGAFMQVLPLSRARHGTARVGWELLVPVRWPVRSTCHFAARLAYLLTHVFIMRVLSCSSREGQGNSSKVRRELAADWFEWLQANPYADIRLPEAVTFSFGNGATLHFDALNDPRFLFDQVTWAVHYVDQLSQYLLTDSLKALADGGVQITNVAFTHLSYTRAIMGIVQVIDSNILPKSSVHYSNRSVLCSTTTASDCMTHPT
jgi:hypothetical protein